MALSGTARGTNTEASADTSATIAPSGNLAASSWAVLVVAVDNADTNGQAHGTFTVTDTKSNTWTRRQSPLYDPGAASAGVEGGIFTTAQNGGTLTTGDTITVTLGVNTTNKVIALWEVTTSGTISYVTGGDGTGSNTATPTVTTGSITSGDMVIGGLFSEAGTAVTYTGDSDTSNGNWSTQQTASVGSGSLGMGLTTQWKTTTGTGTQTYNPVPSAATDNITSYIVLTEGGGGGGAVTRSFAVVIG